MCVSGTRGRGFRIHSERLNRWRQGKFLADIVRSLARSTLRWGSHSSAARGRAWGRGCARRARPSFFQRRRWRRRLERRGNGSENDYFLVRPPASSGSVFLPSFFSFFIWLQQGVQLTIQRERITVQCGKLDSNAQPSLARPPTAYILIHLSTFVETTL